MCDLTDSYVWHDSSICVVRSIHMCATSIYMSRFPAQHLRLRHDLFIEVKDAPICVIWLIHMCDVTDSYMWHDPSMYMTGLIHMFDRSYVYVHSRSGRDLQHLLAHTATIRTKKVEHSLLHTMQHSLQHTLQHTLACLPKHLLNATKLAFSLNWRNFTERKHFMRNSENSSLVTKSLMLVLIYWL